MSGFLQNPIETGAMPGTFPVSNGFSLSFSLQMLDCGGGDEHHGKSGGQSSPTAFRRGTRRLTERRRRGFFCSKSRPAGLSLRNKTAFQGIIECLNSIKVDGFIKTSLYCGFGFCFPSQLLVEQYHYNCFISR